MMAPATDGDGPGERYGYRQGGLLLELLVNKRRSAWEERRLERQLGRDEGLEQGHERQALAAQDRQRDGESRCWCRRLTLGDDVSPACEGKGQVLEGTQPQVPASQTGQVPVRHGQPAPTGPRPTTPACKVPSTRRGS